MSEIRSNQTLSPIHFNPRFSDITDLSKNKFSMTFGLPIIDENNFFNVADLKNLDENDRELNRNSQEEFLKQRVSQFVENVLTEDSKKITARRKLTVDQIPQEQLLEMALSFLQKPSNMRNIHEVKLLVKATEKITFFQQLTLENGVETHELCVKNMTHKFSRKDDIVFSIGTVGSTFYVILNGSVSVWVNIPKQDSHESPDKPPELELTELKTLYAGDSFGELALMDNKPRAATIICKENSHFAVLEKVHFNKILRDIQTKKLFAQLDYFASLKIFSDWTYNSVKNLYYYATQMETIRNQIIYKTNEETKNFYMIKQGEFKMRCILKSEQKKDLEPLGALAKGNVRKGFDLAVLGPGEVFGEEEILEDSKRTASVTCVSNTGLLFVLSKKEFLRRVLTDENTKKYLNEQFKIKKKWRENRIKEFMQATDFNKPKETKETRNSIFIQKPDKNTVNGNSPKSANSPGFPRRSTKFTEGFPIPPLVLNRMSVVKINSEPDNLGESTAILKTDKSKKSLKDLSSLPFIRSISDENDESFSLGFKTLNSLNKQSEILRERQSQQLTLNPQFFNKILNKTRNSVSFENDSPESSPTRIFENMGFPKRVSQISSSVSFKNLPDEIKGVKDSYSKKLGLPEYHFSINSPNLKKKIEIRLQERSDKLVEEPRETHPPFLKNKNEKSQIREFIQNSANNEDINKLEAFKKINEIKRKYTQRGHEAQFKPLLDILMSEKEKKAREFKEKRIRHFFEKRNKYLLKLDSKIVKTVCKPAKETPRRNHIIDSTEKHESSLPEMTRKEDFSYTHLKLNKTLLPLKYNVDDIRACKESKNRKFMSSKRVKIQSTLKEITLFNSVNGVSNFPFL